MSRRNSLLYFSTVKSVLSLSPAGVEINGGRVQPALIQSHVLAKSLLLCARTTNTTEKMKAARNTTNRQIILNTW